MQNNLAINTFFGAGAAGELLSSVSCEMVDKARTLLAAPLFLVHAGEGNRLTVQGDLVVGTDFQVSRYRRDVSHMPRIH